MTIDEQGFLSVDMQGWIKKHRAENQSWFRLAEDLNKIGHRLLGMVNVPASDNQAFLSALLFMRGMSDFQGAILMAERGMTQQARTLTRGCFETVFCFGAVRADSAFAEAFIRDDFSRRQTMARALLKLPADGSGLDPHHIEKLTGFLDHAAQSGVDAETLKFERAAQIAGLTEVYDTFYRGLSNDAAHPSVTSLNRHVEADEDRVITGLRWGPDVQDVGGTVSFACTAAVHLIVFAMNMLNQDEKMIGLDRCWEEYKRLINEQVGEPTA